MTSLIVVRPMTSDDRKGISLVEEACFTNPMSEDDILNYLVKNHGHGLVADCDGEIVGFLLWHTTRFKWTLANAVVHSDHRRKKVGSRLVCEFKELFRTQRNDNQDTIEMMVSEKDLDLLLFLKSQEFRVYQTFKLRCGDHDAFNMVFSISNREAKVPVVPSIVRDRDYKRYE